MALVMLPCDLPWWPAVVKQLDRAGAARNSKDLVEAMEKIHDMCNISLDPDEDEQDPNLFIGLSKFIDEDLGPSEREQLFNRTIPRIVERAKALRNTKPPQGLYFSLQQQGDNVEYTYGFASSLVANAFFSTYPKRTTKTHPTLGDFNFTNFFKHLRLNSQKSKLRSILQYFEFIENESALEGRMIVSRQVMTSKQWLTIEDWLESQVPLCPLTIRHAGRMERVDIDTRVLHVCFASSRFGDGALEDIVNQETVHISTHPELLAVILSVEALEDNEVLIVEGARHISRINDPKNKAIYESIPNPNPVTVCCMDPEDYSNLPLTQFEEDNVLREMNKSLLAFRQRHVPGTPTDTIKSDLDADSCPATRRLSPIGESFSSASPEVETEEKKIPSTNGNMGSNETNSPDRNEDIRGRPNGRSVRSQSPSKLGKSTSSGSNRSRFIVLGSSGEVLPVTRKSLGQMSVYGSCNSQSTESFHSAKDTIDEELPDDDEQRLSRRYSNQLDTPERRGTFAQRLKEALNRESTASGSSDNSSGESSYAVGISITGSHVGDQDIKVKRGGSRGFVLRDETVDEDFLKESLEAEQKWLGRFKQTQPPVLQRRDTSASSKYSFSTEYSSEFCSELEEVYEQLSKWLDDPIASDENRELDARDRAVVQFAGSLLRRALSESFAGVPVQEGEPQTIIGPNDVQQKHKLALAVRSLSLELARQRNKRQQSVSDSEDEEYSDAVDLDSRKKSLSVTFTSTVLQTLAEEVATVCLPSSGTEKKKLIGSTEVQDDGNIRKSQDVDNNLNIPETQRDKAILQDYILVEDFKGYEKRIQIPGENSLQDGGLLPVATGNWGCGSRLKGDPQLKLVIQWVAASLAGVPRLIYYTCGHSSLSKLDTVSRVLTDRRWSVGDLSTAMLRFAVHTLEDRVKGRNSLFEELIGVDKPSP